MYTYDADGNRADMFYYSTNMMYTWDSSDGRNRLVWTKDHLLNTTIYGYGPDGLAWSLCDGNYKVYHYDYRGSVVAITDGSGSITNTYKYDAYGRVVEKTGSGKSIFGFNGQYGVLTDPNGMLYMRARFYSPEYRRFTTADVLKGSIADSTSLNLYTFVNGDPINSVDPYGMSAERAQKKYRDEFNDSINGIGMLSDGTIIRGINATDYDVLMLAEIDIMNIKGYSQENIMKKISDYVDWRNKEGGTVIVKGKNIDYYTNFEDITKSLFSKLIVEEYELSFGFDEDTNRLIYPSDYAYWFILLPEFKENVQNGGIWDLKQYEEWQQSSLYYFNGELVDKDAPGNIMYGYMGKIYGIPDDVLYAAAGYAQIKAGTSSLLFIDSWFDDPMDQENIRRGIELFYRTHHN